MRWHSRSASPSDLDRVEALVAASIEPAWSRAQLSETLAEPITRIRLAEVAPQGDPGGRAGSGSGDEGALLGFVIARRILDILEVDLVGVRPDHRRGGIATQLLRDLIDREVAEGLSEARLELAAANDAARSLYSALGFVVVGRRSRYYPDGDDALLLSRTHFERRSDSPA